MTTSPLSIDRRLTRYLYRVDEACCMFRSTLSCGKIPDALFWAEELFISGCIVEIDIVMLDVWFFMKGLSDVEWIILWYNTPNDRRSVLENSLRLCWTIRDGIDNRLLKECVFPTPTPIHRKADKASSLRNKVFKILTHIQTALPSQEVVGAFWRLSISGANLNCRKYRSIQDEELIIPDGRISVSRSAIYGLSERGNLLETETTIGEVRGDIVDTLWSQGTPYWSEAFIGYDMAEDEEDMGGGPSILEEFYVKHFPFPHDIPDEWSLAKQMVTHGPGSLFIEERDGASIVKLLQNLFRGCKNMVEIFRVFDGKKIDESSRTIFEIIRM